MSDEFWRKWMPGVLCPRQMSFLCEEGIIRGTPAGAKPDTSSLDLHISDQGLRLIQGSIKPFGGKYWNYISKDRSLSEEMKLQDGIFRLEPRSTYVFKLRESLDLPPGSRFYGQATARSTIGRLDILARLIVDGMNCYESFDPASKDASGDLFVEITPISFPVLLKPDTAVTQLRIFYGPPDDAVIQGEEIYDTLLRREDKKKMAEGFLSVDVTNTKLWGKDAAAFSAKSGADAALPTWELDETSKPDPREYWDIQPSKSHKGKAARLQIEREKFYILRSKESISVPPNVAVYCRATDETIGEMRIHYAGFVHPWWGYDRDDKVEGTPLIFEVRGHDVDVSLIDDEKLCRLVFYRMSEQPKKPDKQSYETQVLKLSKIFKSIEGDH